MYGQPEITKYTIKCEECGKLYKKITSAHLKLHGLTISEYKEKWGLCISQPLEALYIKKLRQDYEKQYNSRSMVINHPQAKPFKKGVSTWKNRKIPFQMYEKIVSNGKKMVKHTKLSKQKISESSRKLWLNKDYRDKSIKTYKQIYNTPEMKERFSKQSKKFWSDKNNIEKMSKIRKKICEYYRDWETTQIP